MDIQSHAIAGYLTQIMASKIVELVSFITRRRGS